MPRPPFPLPPRITVGPWPDPGLDAHGHDPRSAYVETFWLGVLGPSTTLLLRRLAAALEERPGGFTIDLADTARALGLSGTGARNTPFVRAVDRATQFGLAHRPDADTLLLRRRFPPVARRLLDRLPPSVQQQHQAWAEHEQRARVDEARRRARALALSLLELGEDAAATEGQLHRWRFHPAMASEAVAWAGHELALRRRSEAPTSSAGSAPPAAPPARRPAPGHVLAG